MMWRGIVETIHIAATAAAPMRSVGEARAVEGRGLDGDRYCSGTGTWSRTRTAGPVTLIEIETIEALRRDHGIEVTPGDCRRNIVTRGVPLAHLIGLRFRVGAVELRGLRLVEPCDHLARLTDRRLLAALVHRGGLRADVVGGGIIRIGDVVQPILA
jgi:hypothetical protein